MSDFFAYAAGPVLATVLFIGLPLGALVMARTFVRRL